MPERRADLVVSRALDWMGRQPGQFFEWVHVFDPHSPYRPPDDLAAQYGSQPYYGEVAFVDRALGPLFDRLSSLSRPTLIIVTADHGESLGEHGELTHGMFAYEATIHIPLIVARIDPRSPSPASGLVIDSAARHIDIVPTVLDLVGAEPDPKLLGSSLRGVIDGSVGDRPSYFESMTYNLVRGWAPLRGVLQERSKYIDLPIPELYDLRADPKEAQNLAPAHRDRLQVLNNLLRTYNVAPPDRPGQETADAAAALRSLGYVQGSAPARAAYTEADDPKRLVEIDRMLTQGNDALRAGRADEAADVYKAIIAKRPDTEDAYRKLALIYWRQQRPRLAVETLEAALRAGITQSEVRIKLGQYLAESGQAEKAIELLSATSGNDPDAIMGLGNAYMLAGRNADAIRTFTRLLQIDPGNGLAWENLGTTQLQAKDVKGAETSLRRAIQIDPSLSGAYTALGVVLAQTGRRDEAIAAWKRALELDPSDENAAFNLKRVGPGTGR